METLNLMLVQKDIIWENIETNLKSYSTLIETPGRLVDLIVLPEMFNTGFTMNAAKNAESMEGKSVNWMKKLSQQTGAAVTGSLIIKEEQRHYNRMLFILPDGRIEYYNKRHLFRLTEEHKVFEKGIEKVIVDYKSWKINLNVCYDLRFPAWSRNQNDYDLLINVASWPDSRIEHWSALLKARAIENLSYVIGVNRVGKDENGFYYNGYTSAYDPSGKKLLQLVGREKTQLLRISKEKLSTYRTKFPFYQDQDQFSISN